MNLESYPSGRGVTFHAKHDHGFLINHRAYSYIIKKYTHHLLPHKMIRRMRWYYSVIPFINTPGS